MFTLEIQVNPILVERKAGAPQGTAGHRRAPQGTAGHRRAPQGTAGHRRAPQGTAGHRRARRAPQDTAGHRRTPQDTAGHRRTPQDTGVSQGRGGTQKGVNPSSEISQEAWNGLEWESEVGMDERMSRRLSNKKSSPSKMSSLSSLDS